MVMVIKIYHDNGDDFDGNDIHRKQNEFMKG